MNEQLKNDVQTAFIEQDAMQFIDRFEVSEDGNSVMAFWESNGDEAFQVHDGRFVTGPWAKSDIRYGQVNKKYVVTGLNPYTNWIECNDLEGVVNTVRGFAE